MENWQLTCNGGKSVSNSNLTENSHLHHCCFLSLFNFMYDTLGWERSSSSAISLIQKPRKCHVYNCGTAEHSFTIFTKIVGPTKHSTWTKTHYQCWERCKRSSSVVQSRSGPTSTALLYTTQYCLHINELTIQSLLIMATRVNNRNIGTDNQPMKLCERSCNLVQHISARGTIGNEFHQS